MEKLKPTYDLNAFKQAFSSVKRLCLTSEALHGARALGLRAQEIVEVIQSMERRQFYKSMTSYANHREWQDVYHVPRQGVVIYVKFTGDVVSEFRLLSFKEK